ncbi:unnamed protein product [Medioppia subpectinata]|uniref:BTB domain-containing protein n=1 Tax=Medioppia subpectinata TaxID=1979941 RepID=A0A7R9Q3C2_9ACAR|nr:unnamed protein product [Medioppia subpectinata]CAG2110407.1 unnamed protein product [Medioppia subpectinata]
MAANNGYQRCCERTTATTPSLAIACGNRCPKTTMKDRLSSLYDNHVMADVVFICRANETLMAHKLILALASRVFDQLFNHCVNESALKVSAEDGMTYVELKDCHIDDLRPVVRYMYTDDVCDITDANVANVVFWAKKLTVQPVIDKCVHFLRDKINANNCLNWWTKLAPKLADETQLMARCLEMIAANASNLFKSKDIINVSLNELNVLLDRNDLDIKEVDLFNAAILWSRQQCIRRGLVCDDRNLRQTLGVAFEKIRFPVMSSVDFGHIVDKHKELFVKEELCSLIAYINAGVLPKTRLPFNARLREPTESLLFNTYQQMCCPSNQPSTACCSPTTPLGYQTYVCLCQSYTDCGFNGHVLTSPTHSLHVSSLMPPPPSQPYSPNFGGYGRKVSAQTSPPGFKERKRVPLTITDPKSGQRLNIQDLAAGLQPFNANHGSTVGHQNNHEKKIQIVNTSEVTAEVSAVDSECDSLIVSEDYTSDASL